jgi:hypothetical protein
MYKKGLHSKPHPGWLSSSIHFHPCLQYMLENCSGYSSKSNCLGCQTICYHNAIPWTIIKTNLPYYLKNRPAFGSHGYTSASAQYCNRSEPFHYKCEAKECSRKSQRYVWATEVVLLQCGSAAHTPTSNIMSLIQGYHSISIPWQWRGGADLSDWPVSNRTKNIVSMPTLNHNSIVSLFYNSVRS